MGTDVGRHEVRGNSSDGGWGSKLRDAHVVGAEVCMRTWGEVGDAAPATNQHESHLTTRRHLALRPGSPVPAIPKLPCRLEALPNHFVTLARLHHLQLVTSDPTFASPACHVTSHFTRPFLVLRLWGIRSHPMPLLLKTSLPAVCSFRLRTS